MEKAKKQIKKIKESKKSTKLNALNKSKEENENLKLQLMARERERDEYKRELDEIHESISYRTARRISETEFGNRLKRFLKRHM